MKFNNITNTTGNSVPGLSLYPADYLTMSKMSFIQMSDAKDYLAQNAMLNLLLSIRLGSVYYDQALMMLASNMAFIQFEAQYLAAYSATLLMPKVKNYMFRPISGYCPAVDLPFGSGWAENDQDFQNLFFAKATMLVSDQLKISPPAGIAITTENFPSTGNYRSTQYSIATRSGLPLTNPLNSQSNQSLAIAVALGFIIAGLAGVLISGILFVVVKEIAREWVERENKVKKLDKIRQRVDNPNEVLSHVDMTKEKEVHHCILRSQKLITLDFVMTVELQSGWSPS